MHVAPVAASSSDLARVQALFDAWRARRSHHRERIPADLWDAAVGLLDSLPLAAVAKQLRLAPAQLRRRRDALVGSSTPRQAPSFVELSVAAFPTSSRSHGAPGSDCRLVLERADGSRLSLALPPAAWDRVESLVHVFLAGR